ncbi:MAG: energy-coupling factor transporter transmembrane protein EcfT [Clostridia bacterium]|nr:energy-coupling factor transporter transmembrane protein EcfT [Clostridia bacterium]
MLKDMTLGQFFPGNSILHRLDARMKFILTILYIVAIFLAKNVFCYAALVVSALLLVLLSRLSFRVVLRSIKPIVMILLFTAAISIFFTKGEGEPLWSFWRIAIYKEGILRSVFMALRVIVLVVGTSVFLTYTTSPIVLTNAFESLLAPLKKIRVPVHDFAMILTIALRFIPTLVEETDKIIGAQKSRGAAFDSGSLLRRAKALVPVIIPLLVSSFNRADELATAMECRCYRGDVGRTRFVKMRYHVRDFVALFLFAAFLTLIVLGNLYLPIGFSV